jgi:hypothetical protein
VPRACPGIFDPWTTCSWTDPNTTTRLQFRREGGGVGAAQGGRSRSLQRPERSFHLALAVALGGADVPLTGIARAKRARHPPRSLWVAEVSL